MNQPNLQIGRCSICGNEAVIIERDPGTGLNAGRCCASDLRYAHEQINLVMATVVGHGLRHPRAGEFGGEENH